MTNSVAPEFRRAVVMWLSVCAFLVFCMVWVGGLTRLTESGLSIVDWRPVTGAIPPISLDDWQVEFDKYKTSPQYQKVNQGMSLDDFKGIFWLEYVHRLLARGLGFAFLLPFIYFAAQRAFSRSFGLRLLGIFALGGLQGLMGWIMVKSGLENDPWVSPVKLGFHLGLAFIIFALILWTLLNVRREGRMLEEKPRKGTLYGWAVALCVMVYIQVILGALVAGNDAGLTYNTFPMMDGKLIPDGMWAHMPAWINLFENVAMVQFNHRIMAYMLTACTVWFCWRGWRQYPEHATWFYAVLTCMAAQFLLGVFTLLLVVPISLAVLHQANAMILFGFCLKLAHLMRPLPEENSLVSSTSGKVATAS